jgi:hypothetical protein
VTGPGARLPAEDPRLPALQLLRPPAFILLALGCVNILFSVAGLVISALGKPLPFTVGGTPLVTPPLDVRLALAVGVGILVGALQVRGALSAMGLRRYGATIIGAAAAMAPIFPMCVPGTLVGIWMLVALRKPGVRSAFSG